MATYYWVGGTGNWSDATNHWATASNGAPNAANVPTSADDVVFDVNSNVGTGSFSVTLTALGNCRNFTASGLDGVMTFSPGLFAMQIAGNLSIPASNFTTASISGAFSFTGSGTSTVTTNGVTINHSIQLTGTGTVQLVDNLTIASNRTFTLSSGTLDLNNKVLSVGIFSSNNSNARSIAFGGTGQIYLTATSATICAFSNHTNYTVTGTPIFNVTDPSTTGTRTINYGAAAQGGSATTAATFNISAGTDTITFGSSYINNLDLTGFAGTLTNSTLNVVGNYTLSSGVTVGAGGATTTFLPSSGTKTITTSGKTLDFPLAFNGGSNISQFQDALTQGSTRTFNCLSGTVQLKTGVTNTVGSFLTTGTTLKYLRSTVAGTQATLSQATGTVTATYLDIRDSIATGGATFDATDPTNVNAGNNTGWLFAATAFIRTLFARATSNGNFLIPTEMEFNEVNQTNFRVSKNNLSVYANEFIEVASGTKVILLESGSAWIVPSDWDSTNNTIHLIGGGASGAGTGYDGVKYLGGGGGGYTKISNFNTTPGSVITYSVGLGGIAGNTNDNVQNLPPTLGGNTTFNSSMYVAGGAGQGRANGSIGGIGSTFNGGNGAFTASGLGAGGGGAAGPYGNGGNAIDNLGGVGDAGFGGSANVAGYGLSGTEINGYGSGSGASASDAPAVGGKYGGGGSSTRAIGPINFTGENGANGVIIITYSGTDYTQRITNTGNLLISGTFIESANI